MVASQPTKPSLASITSSTTSASRICRRAITTLSFSAISFVLPLRRIPAVSTKTNSRPVALDGFIHRIARRAGDRRNDRAILAGQRVQQRRFADIRPPDDGDLDAARLRRSSAASSTGKSFGDVIEQRIHAHAMLGGDRKNILDPQRIEIVDQVFFRARCRTCSPPAKRACRSCAASPQARGPEPVISPRPSTRKITCEACSSATRACARIWLGNVIGVADDHAAGVDQLEPACLRAWRSHGCDRA